MKYSIAVVAACLPHCCCPVLAWADSPLADAVEKKDKAAFRTLLKSKCDVNAAEVDGMTALHWAAHHDDLKAAQMLLEPAQRQTPKTVIRSHAAVFRLPKRKRRVGRTAS